jgi:hypothetical protein
MLPLKTRHRHRPRPVRLKRILPEGTPLEVCRAAGFVARAKRVECPRPGRAHHRHLYPRDIRRAASTEGESWALALCWFLRWVQGWQGPITERKRGNLRRRAHE